MSEGRYFQDERVTTATLCDFRSRLEALLLRGARRVAFVPDNAVARRLAEESRQFSASVDCRFFQREMLGATEFASVFHALSEVDVVVVCVDREKLSILSWLNRLPWTRFPEVIAAGVAHQERHMELIDQIERANAVMSHARGYEFVKAHLCDIAEHVSRRFQDGTVVEMGTFRGGTLLLLDGFFREIGAPAFELLAFDTFAGFGPRRHLLDLFRMDRFEDRDVASIERRLIARGVGLVQGDIADTAALLRDRDLVLTFFDTDNYSPTHAALPICFERTRPGGAIVFDHYFTRPDFAETVGERVAAEEFFSSRSDYFHLSGTGVFVKL